MSTDAVVIAGATDALAPPGISTLPLERVIACENPRRALSWLALANHVLWAGSYTSADARAAPPAFPPTSRTRPSISSVPPADARAVPNGAAIEKLFVAG